MFNQRWHDDVDSMLYYFNRSDIMSKYVNIESKLSFCWDPKRLQNVFVEIPNVYLDIRREQKL